MSQKGFVNIIVIIGVVVLAVVAGYFIFIQQPQSKNSKEEYVVGERNGHKLVRVQRCSDYCPPEIMEQSWVVEYAEAKTPQECRDIGGYPKKDPAWGGYFGCSPDPVGPKGLYTEDLQSAENNETRNWQIYRNTKYNYSFRYPTSFTIYANIDQVKEEVILPTATSDKVSLTDRKGMLFCCEPLVTSVSVIKGSIDTKNWRQYAEIPDYRIKSQGEIMFTGHKAFEVRGSLGIDSAGVRLILIPGNQFSFILIQGDDGEPWESITNSFSFK